MEPAQNPSKRRKRGYWRSDDGRRELDAALQGTSYRRFSDQWTASSLNDQVCIECTACGRNMMCNLQNVLKRKSAACFCTGKVPWASRDGWQHIRRKLEASKWDVPSLSVFEEWEKLAPTAHTSLPIRCSECGIESSTTIDCLLSNKNNGSRCLCSNSAPWKTNQGRQRLIALCDKVGVFVPSCAQSESMWQELDARFSTCISFQCIACNAIVESSILNLLQSEKIWCNCPGRKQLWSTEDGRQRVLNFMKTTRFQPLGILLDQHEWEKAHVVNTTRLDMECTKCNTATSSTSLVTFMKTGGSGCKCLARMQHVVFEHCVAAFPHMHVVSEQQVENKGHLKYDIAMFSSPPGPHPILAIEIDGIQHFEYPNPFHSTFAAFEKQKECDFRKNKLSTAMGVTMLRLDWRSVYHNHVDWKAKIESTLSMLNHCSAKVVCVSHLGAYSKV